MLLSVEGHPLNSQSFPKFFWCSNIKGGLRLVINGVITLTPSTFSNSQQSSDPLQSSEIPQTNSIISWHKRQDRGNGLSGLGYLDILDDPNKLDTISTELCIQNSFQFLHGSFQRWVLGTREHTRCILEMVIRTVSSCFAFTHRVNWGMFWRILSWESPPKKKEKTSGKPILKTNWAQKEMKFQTQKKYRKPGIGISCDRCVDFEWSAAFTHFQTLCADSNIQGPYGLKPKSGSKSLAMSTGRLIVDIPVCGFNPSEKY